MAIGVDRYKVRNGNDPNHGNVTEEKNQMKIIMEIKIYCYIFQEKW